MLDYSLSFKEILSLSASMPNIMHEISSPFLYSLKSGVSSSLLSERSDECIRPSISPSNPTKTPKSVTDLMKG